LKKIKNRNIFAIAHDKCLTFQRVKDPYTPEIPGSISKPKMVYCKVCTEGIGTAKFGIDEMKQLL